MKKFELELHLLYTPLDAALQLVLAEAKKVPLGQQGPEVIKVFNNSGQHTATLRRIDTREDSLSVENAEPQHRRSQRSQFKPERQRLQEFAILDFGDLPHIWHYEKGEDVGRSGWVINYEPHWYLGSAWARRARWEKELLGRNQRRFGTVNEAMDWLKNRKNLPRLVVVNNKGTVWHYEEGEEICTLGHINAQGIIDYCGSSGLKRHDKVAINDLGGVLFDNAKDAVKWYMDQRLPELVVLNVRLGKMLVAAAGSEYVCSVHLADDPSDYHETYYRREGVLELVQKQPDRFKRFDNEAAARTWWKIDRLTEWVLADRLTGTIWYYPGGEELGKKADIIDLSTWSPLSMKRWEALELLRNGCTKSFKTVAEAVCWLSR